MNGNTLGSGLTFRRTRNMVKISLRLSPEGPFLIKARESMDPTRPDMEFVRLQTPYSPALYVPGSSLKGVVRATTEALLRSVSRLSPPICDPLDLRAGACTSAAKKPQQNRSLSYEEHCDACKMFGSTEMAGRLRFGDLLPWTRDMERKTAIETLQKHISVRTGVAIDRATGQAKGGALYEMETVSGGNFFGDLAGQNVPLWQLGLILMVFDRVDDGTIRLGFGKSRGLGNVRLQVEEITFEQFGAFAADKSWLNGADEDRPERISAQGTWSSVPLGQRFVAKRADVEVLKADLFRMVSDRYTL